MNIFQLLDKLKLALVFVGGLVILLADFYNRGKKSAQNDQRKKEEKGIKTARKVEAQTRNLSRSDLIDKL